MHSAPLPDGLLGQIVSVIQARPIESELAHRIGGRRLLHDEPERGGLAALQSLVASAVESALHRVIPEQGPAPSLRGRRNRRGLEVEDQPVSQQVNPRPAPDRVRLRRDPVLPDQGAFRLHTSFRSTPAHTLSNAATICLNRPSVLFQQRCPSRLNDLVPLSLSPPSCGSCRHR